MKGLLFKRVVSGIMLGAFVLTSVLPSYAQMVAGLPVPGTMITPTDAFTPAIFKGMKVYPKEPLRFDFIVDTGNDTTMTISEDAKRALSEKLVRYFLAALTTPEKDLWVNLSPYEGERIIPDFFGQTEMGRDLLAQDYILKQITASVIYPEGETGKVFWAKIYQQAWDTYGTTDIPVDTFNKVWITPEKATVYVNGDVAVIKSSHLKVQLESDYLAMSNNSTSNDVGLNSKATQGNNGATSEETEIAKSVMREVVIPVLEKEVNEGKNFAQLRQIYHAMVLATWFKRNLKESLVGRVYMDQNKVGGIDLVEKGAAHDIWAQYVEAFKKGVFNYIKEEEEALTGEMIPRKYFSGGFLFGDDAAAVEIVDASQIVMQLAVGAVVGLVVMIKARFNAERARPVGEAGSDDTASGTGMRESNGSGLSRVKKYRGQVDKLLEEINKNLNTRALDTQEEVLGIFEKPDLITGRLFELASLLRMNFSYERKYSPRRTPAELRMGPLAYAIESGVTFEIAKNLYISPLTESFKRHFIYKTDDQGNILFAYEFMIPGDKWNTKHLGAARRKNISQDIEQRASGRHTVSVLKAGKFTYDSHGGMFYNKEFPASKREMELCVYDYPIKDGDGSRLTNITLEQKKQWAEDMGIDLHALELLIARQVTERFLIVRRLGYHGLMDMHPENFRVGLRHDNQGKVSGIEVLLVADFSGYKRLKELARIGLIIAASVIGSFVVGGGIVVGGGVFEKGDFIASFNSLDWRSLAVIAGISTMAVPVADYLALFALPGYSLSSYLTSLNPLDALNAYREASRSASLKGSEYLVDTLLTKVYRSVGMGFGSGAVVSLTAFSKVENRIVAPIIRKIYWGSRYLALAAERIKMIPFKKLHLVSSEAKEERDPSGGAEQVSDTSAANFDKGGIDLNSEQLDLQEEGGKIDLSASVGTALTRENVTGFVPVVFSIKPLTDPQELFAVSPLN